MSPKQHILHNSKHIMGVCFKFSVLRDFFLGVHILIESSCIVLVFWLGFMTDMSCDCLTLVES